MKLLGTLAVAVVLMFSARVGTAAVVGVAMRDPYFFTPTNVVINPGDRVVWTNLGTRAHDTRHAVATPLWASPSMPVNATFGFTFTNLGYYPYRCQQHVQAGPQQTGTVSVVQISLAPVTSTPNSTQFDIRGGRQGLKAAVDVGGTLGSWAPLATNGFPQGGTLRFTNNAPPVTNRFYRARALP